MTSIHNNKKMSKRQRTAKTPRTRKKLKQKTHSNTFVIVFTVFGAKLTEENNTSVRKSTNQIPELNVDTYMQMADVGVS